MLHTFRLMRSKLKKHQSDAGDRIFIANFKLAYFITLSF